MCGGRTAPSPRPARESTPGRSASGVGSGYSGQQARHGPRWPMNAPQIAATRAASPQHLAWLRTELADWTSSGVITDAQAAQISGRYHEQAGAGSRFTIGRRPALPRRRLRRHRPDLAGRRQPRPAGPDGPLPRRRRPVARLPRRRRVPREPVGVAPGRRCRPADGRPGLRGPDLPGGPVAPGAGLRAAPDRPLGRRRAAPRLPRPGVPAVPRRARHGCRLVAGPAAVGRADRAHRRARCWVPAPSSPRASPSCTTAGSIASRGPGASSAGAWRSRRCSWPPSPTSGPTTSPGPSG